MDYQEKFGGYKLRETWQRMRETDTVLLVNLRSKKAHLYHVQLGIALSQFI